MHARLVLALAAVLAGLSSPAAADFPRKSPRASLVQVLRGGKQALVLDRASGEYQVVKVGDAVQGFRVSEIEEDQIVLASPSAPERFFVLPLIEAPASAPRDLAAVPPPAGTGAPSAPAPAVPPAADAPLEGADSEGDVLDPYAGSGGASLAGDASVLDPYGATPDPGGIPSVIAPPSSRAPTPDAGAGSVSPSPGGAIAGGAIGIDPGLDVDSVSGSGAGAPPTKPKVTTVEPTEVRPGSPSPAAAPSPREEARKLSRRQLDAALADFSALAKQIRIERIAGGGVRIAELERRSFFAGLGLERGDVVRRVAGHPIDTVDEAAAAYAALGSARDVLVEIERRGATHRIRYQLIK